MTTELFQGNPQALKVRLDALITASSPTILQVIATSEKSWYLIIWS
jgi:hypothetical protein